MEHKLKGTCNVCGKEVSATMKLKDDSTALYVRLQEKRWLRDVHVCKACQLEWYRTHTRIPNITTDRVMNALDSLNHVTGTRFDITEKCNSYREELENLIRGKVAYLKETHKEYVLSYIYQTEELDAPLTIGAREVDSDSPWTASGEVRVCEHIETHYNEFSEVMYLNIDDLEFTDEVFTERWECVYKLYKDLKEQTNGRKTKKNKRPSR